MSHQTSRRGLLRAGTGIAVSLGLAGCSSIPGLGGGGNYRNWLHEPGQLRDANHYQMTYVDATTVVDNRSELSDQTFSTLEPFVNSSAGVAGVDIHDADWSVSTNATQVTSCSRSRDELMGDLENDNYGEETEYNGYTIMTPDGTDQPTRAMAVQQGTIIDVNRLGEPVEGAEDVIDVKRAERPRYAEQSEAFSTLVGAVNNESILYLLTRDRTEVDNPESGQFDGSVGIGIEYTINGANSDIQYIIAYESEADVDTGDLQDWVDANNGQDQLLDDVEGLEVSQSGAAGTVSGQIDTDDIQPSF